MSIAEAALYGDLVQHLRDLCAQQLAQLKGVSVESERAALDEVIRAWFFAPQDDLYGLTPQRVIRNEELGIANTIPADRLGDLFEDDCPVCAAMRADAEAGLATDPDHDHGWSFGLAPDFSLLDEYDPEGSDERWRIEEERMEASLAERKAEAQALPFVGADDPDLARDIRQKRAWLDEDIPF
ncbi:MAG: hypothetical protein HUU23_18215 [Caldilineales bacterium]|nr:hypothetical protein [Caldilineales bacterium]